MEGAVLSSSSSMSLFKSKSSSSCCSSVATAAVLASHETASSSRSPLCNHGDSGQIIQQHRESQNGDKQSHLRTVALFGSYMLFGAIHEVSHLSLAVYHRPNLLHLLRSKQQQVTLPSLLASIFIQRQCPIPIINDDDWPWTTNELFWIQHVGWIVSCCIAVSVNFIVRRNRHEIASTTTCITSILDLIRWAALITAIEALSTDLFGLDIPLLLPWNDNMKNGTSSSILYFYCGNFGVIMLHHLWYTQNAKSDGSGNALDVMQRMIQVTMMRGAQSGGVVTFQPPPSKELMKQSCRFNNYTPKLEWNGIRSRVVNGKRTDLSELVRKQVEKDVFKKKKYGNGPGKNKVGSDKDMVVPILAGHTRFATSSKATLDGTHPHQWCPSSKRRIYNFSSIMGLSSTQKSKTQSIKPNVVNVENYITHNGDFDFYKMTSHQNKTYDLQTIQKWLVYVTKCPMPSSVDSCAIAGMIDLLHTQGCFGLSIRYVLGFLCSGVDSGAGGRGNGPANNKASHQIPRRSVLDDIDNESNLDYFPEYDHLERIGLVFEEVLADMLQTTTKVNKKKAVNINDSCGDDDDMRIVTIHDIGKSQYYRHKFALRVRDKIKESPKLYQDLILPIAYHLDLGDDGRKAPMASFTDRSLLSGPADNRNGEVDDDHNNKSLSSILRKINNDSMMDSSTMVIEEGSQFQKAVTATTPTNDSNEDEENFGDGGGSDKIPPNYKTLLFLCRATIDAFFDNDLFQSTKIFMENAKGSFGLVVMSSLDADRQICLAARGQTMSIAFYPRKGLICYGSEQAAVKAGMSFPFPGSADSLGASQGDVDNDALRLDLDDLGGEILLLDWGKIKYGNSSPPVSYPNSHLLEHDLMNGHVTAILYQESKSTTQDPQIYHRMTRLSRNRLIRPLRPESSDLIQTDLHDIPNICRSIQDEWHSNQAGTSLNRLTAFNLSRCLRRRLEAHVKGALHPQSIDILLTGCEVSLWLAEQFASDLQKSFPLLRVKAVSSNKLLGLYGQDVAVPCLGFPYGTNSSHSLHDAIVIIVSHSGGTFSPLSCSNLLQSTTRNIFVVTSEWDTQIGKQLRAMDSAEDEDDLFNCRIFSTGVGIRPAEPCSVSVVATHQLLTNLFEYISAIILGDQRFRAATEAVITEQDLKELERCNQLNVGALVDIVGANSDGYALDKITRTERELRDAGDWWAEHILENARAYIMSIFYIFVTVTVGYPLFYAIATVSGLDMATSEWAYLVRAVDALFFIWLPQINITILRILQGRDLKHRMVGRTVVVGDIPWVAQSAEAFLSKIFACSYSIAGLNVLSGNPADHFVHRHTHRVVRGTLVICGRPDGRLSALSTAEAAVCLSVNQASSIQSLGGTCESITIGHNPFKLDLSKRGIFLGRHRPLFLCERMLGEEDVKNEQNGTGSSSPTARRRSSSKSTTKSRSILWNPFMNRRRDALDTSVHSLDASIRLRVYKSRSAAALLGAYLNIEESENGKGNEESAILNGESLEDERATVDDVIRRAIKERKWSDKARNLFQRLDLDKNGFLSEHDFVTGASTVFPSLSSEEAKAMFHAHVDGTGHLDYDEFVRLLNMNNSSLTQTMKLPPSNRDLRGNIQIEPSHEKYFGQSLRKYNAGKSSKGDMDFRLARSQHFSQELYESRVASLQRFVSMTVMFHQMGKRVQQFFPRISFGLLGYRMDRTHSIMRIATTASPISGADVRQQMTNLRLLKKVKYSIHLISCAYLQYKAKKESKRVKQLEQKVSSASV